MYIICKLLIYKKKKQNTIDNFFSLIMIRKQNKTDPLLTNALGFTFTLYDTVKIMVEKDGECANVSG